MLHRGERLNEILPGQYFDKETGLHYNYFRDGYDSATGRYVQSDPIGLAGGSFSTYSYVGNDPLSSIDPLGLTNTYPRQWGGGGGIGGGSGVQQWGPIGGIGLGIGIGIWSQSQQSQTNTTSTTTSNTSGEQCKPGDKWMCEGPGQYDKVGTQKEVTQMGWFTAYGNTEAEATYNWKKMVQAAAPRGYNARHIRPKKCQKIK